MPQWVDRGVAFVKNNEEWRSGDAFRKCFTVQILPEERKKSNSVPTPHWIQVVFTVGSHFSSKLFKFSRNDFFPPTVSAV